MAENLNPVDLSVNSNYSQDDIDLQDKKIGRLKVKRYSVQEELLPVFWLSGSAALGRDDGFEHLVFSPWRRGERHGTGTSSGGRRYSRQLEIVPSEQRRKSDAARKSASSAAAVSVAALAAMTSSDGGSNLKSGNRMAGQRSRSNLLDTTGKENTCLLAPPKSILYEDGVFLREFDGDTLLIENFSGPGSRRESRQCHLGARASQSSAPISRDPRLTRRKKIVSVFIIIGVGLVVLSLLLVTLMLRLSPTNDDDGKFNYFYFR